MAHIPPLSHRIGDFVHKNADIKSRHEQDIGRFPIDTRNKMHGKNQDINKFECKITRNNTREETTPYSPFRQHQNGWRHFLCPWGCEVNHIWIKGQVQGTWLFASRQKLHSTTHTHTKKKITEHGDLWTTRLVNEAVNAFWSERIKSLQVVIGHWRALAYLCSSSNERRGRFQRKSDRVQSKR